MKNYKAVKALIEYNNKFLLLKKRDFIGGDYDLPGGRKIQEESDEEALKREVREETGLDITIIKLLNIWDLELPEKNIHLEGKTYLCKGFSSRVKLSKEHYSYLWVSRKELDNLRIPTWLKEAMLKL